MSLTERESSRGLRKERVIGSPRFRDGRFCNTAPVGAGLKKGTVLSTIGEYFSGEGDRTPPAPLPVLDPRETWTRPVDSGLRVTWLGHSTVLLEIDGFRVMTDPVFGERASPSRFAGPKRFHPTPVALNALPRLDAVVLSHDHYDHLCAPTIRELGRMQVPIFTSLGVGSHLEKLGVLPSLIHELDWWEEKGFGSGDLSFTAAPAQHFSGRGALDRNSTFWSSWVVKTGRHKVFFSGDTGLTEEFRQIGGRLGPFDLVMLEIGAFHESWGGIHLGPANALKAFSMLGGGTLLPVHWGTFNLGIHPWEEPSEQLLALAAQDGARILTPKLGFAFEPTQHERLEAWWRQVGKKALPAATAAALR